VTAALAASGPGNRHARRWALGNCTLTIPTGRVTGLVGPNGVRSALAWQSPWPNSASGGSAAGSDHNSDHKQGDPIDTGLPEEYF
jgi:hypothetical protein